MLAYESYDACMASHTPEWFAAKAVTDYLTMMRVAWFRMNSGTMLLQAPGGRKRAVQMNAKGTADYLALVPHHDGLFTILWIEVKSAVGRLSPEQKSFRDDVIAKGHSYIVARGADEVEQWFNEYRSK